VVKMSNVVLWVVMPLLAFQSNMQDGGDTLHRHVGNAVTTQMTTIDMINQNFFR
jgi:cytochrome b